MVKLNYPSHIRWRTSRQNDLYWHKIKVGFNSCTGICLWDCSEFTEVSLKFALLCSGLSKNKDCLQGSSRPCLLSVFLFCGKELGKGGNFVLQPQIPAGGFPSNQKSKVTGNWTGTNLYFIRDL